MWHRTQQIVSCIRTRAPRTAVLLLAIPPRGASWPNGVTPYSDGVNARLAAFAAETAGVHFLDAGAALVADGAIPERLMPDRLHPSAAGMEAMAGPIAAEVRRLLAGSAEC